MHARLALAVENMQNSPHVCKLQKRFLTENMGKARRIADDRFQELLIVEAKWLKTELQPFLKKFFAPKLQSSEQSIR